MDLSDISGSVRAAYWPVTVGIFATQKEGVTLRGSFPLYRIGLYLCAKCQTFPDHMRGSRGRLSIARGNYERTYVRNINGWGKADIYISPSDGDIIVWG